MRKAKNPSKIEQWEDMIDSYAASGDTKMCDELDAMLGMIRHCHKSASDGGEHTLALLGSLLEDLTVLVSLLAIRSRKEIRPRKA